MPERESRAVQKERDQFNERGVEVTITIEQRKTGLPARCWL
jgi:hypothetical protein